VKHAVNDPCSNFEVDVISILLVALEFGASAICIGILGARNYPKLLPKAGCYPQMFYIISLFVYDIQKVFGKYASSTKGGIQGGVCAPTLAIV
jgi:hypothetical protein